MRMRQEVGLELGRLEAEAVDQNVGSGDALGEERLVGHLVVEGGGAASARTSGNRISGATTCLSSFAPLLRGSLLPLPRRPALRRGLAGPGRGERVGERHLEGRKSERLRKK